MHVTYHVIHELKEHSRLGILHLELIITGAGWIHVFLVIERRRHCRSFLVCNNMVLCRFWADVGEMSVEMEMGGHGSVKAVENLAVLLSGVLFN